MKLPIAAGIRMAARVVETRLLRSILIGDRESLVGWDAVSCFGMNEVLVLVRWVGKWKRRTGFLYLTDTHSKLYSAMYLYCAKILPFHCKWFVQRYSSNKRSNEIQRWREITTTRKVGSSSISLGCITSCFYPPGWQSHSTSKDHSYDNLTCTVPPFLIFLALQIEGRLWVPVRSYE